MRIHEDAYYKKYNIEWYLGNGDLASTSATLYKIGDDGYCYFKYPDGGLFIIERRAIRSLECLECLEREE